MKIFKKIIQCYVEAVIREVYRREKAARHIFETKEKEDKESQTLQHVPVLSLTNTDTFP